MPSATILAMILSISYARESHAIDCLHSRPLSTAVEIRKGNPSRTGQLTKRNIPFMQGPFRQNISDGDVDVEVLYHAVLYQVRGK
jgi:hypothetical protein